MRTLEVRDDGSAVRGNDARVWGEVPRGAPRPAPAPGTRESVAVPD